MLSIPSPYSSLRLSSARAPNPHISFTPSGRPCDADGCAVKVSHIPGPYTVPIPAGKRAHDVTVCAALGARRAGSARQSPRESRTDHRVDW